ncbi:hypothetical protein O9G_002200 [Rozella allomycis CSF55]|uniref:Lipase n=1 Tax=Rozella allomycis (strain CSF55) TaxID=988480 RepID=A0A075AQC8_ROZAC|nr:hypothetical protein O9G_002200 [Rozella allomycis CSF55]|eukprot:EPZ32360.1 hypothetical protein O9G_002200 [Rozella allomycis CSF55]
MIPILSRLGIRDYMRLLICFVILFIESVVRSFLNLIPFNTGWKRLSRRMMNPVLKFVRTKKRKMSTYHVIEYNDPDTPTMIKQSRGFECEEHLVVTEDGYILVLHRIVPAVKKKAGKPVLFMHGFMMNSEVWVCHPGENQSLTFELASRGYDVWLGNSRGNKYSCKHVKMKPCNEDFWDYALDELAIMDVPAIVDYILDIVPYNSLSYVGFSQGTAQCFASLSINPHLNKKINCFVALAAVTRPSGLENKFVKSLIKITPKLVFLLFGRKNLISSVIWWKQILGRDLYSTCIDKSMNILFGWNTNCIAKEHKPILYSHLYSYGSVKQVVHWFQIYQYQEFQMYDENEEFFASGHQIPKFPLQNIEVPIHLFHGLSDTLSDIAYTLSSCPTNTKVYSIENYEHLDFLWASDVGSQVNKSVIKIIEKLP